MNKSEMHRIYFLQQIEDHKKDNLVPEPICFCETKEQVIRLLDRYLDPKYGDLIALLPGDDFEEVALKWQKM